MNPDSPDSASQEFAGNAINAADSATQAAHVERTNGRLITTANGLQNVGDQTASAKTILPWLLTAAGVPAFFFGLLVPVRESLAMLPQAPLRRWVTSHRRSRKRVWIIGSAGQAVCAGLMALAALTLSGSALGIAVVVLLALLATFRSLSSLSGKDVMGRAISKGRRGAVTGLATTLAGSVTIIVGIVLLFLPAPMPIWVGAILLAIGACAWALAAVVFARVDEHLHAALKRTNSVPNANAQSSSAQPPHTPNSAWYTDTWNLLRDDELFRRFVLVRSLLLVSALSTAFIVAASAQATSAQAEGATAATANSGFADLAPFVLVSGLSALLAGKVSGIWSDRSSKTVMAAAAGASSVVLLILVLSALTAPHWWNTVAFPLGFFLVSLAHAAVRVARSTYLVDMAEDDQRTRYTGAANTIMGVILLLVGALSSVIAIQGPLWALVFLAVIGLGGVWAARSLPEVSEPHQR